MVNLGHGPGERDRYPAETYRSEALSLRFILLAVFFVAPTVAAMARPVPILSYSELLSQSDVVLVVRATEVRDAREGDPIATTDRDASIYLTAIVTNLRVLAVLKGDFSQKSFVLAHFRLDMEKARRNGIEGIGNGPNLASFSISKVDDDNGRPSDGDAIIFLKRKQDGTLVPVTGQFDSTFSVIWVH